MLEKIYQELVLIRKELQLITRENRSAGTSDDKIDASEAREPMQWRRFELTTENEAERERLERVLDESNLSRQDLAIILFGLRVRPEFEKSDFGI